MSRGSGQYSNAAPEGTIHGRPRSTTRQHSHGRRTLPAGVAGHRGAPRHRCVRGAGRPRAHLVLLHPPDRDRPRDRVARPDARGHSRGHRPVDTRGHGRRRKPGRRDRSGLGPQAPRRDPRRARCRRARGPRQRRPRRSAAAQPTDRHAGGGPDRPRLEQQVLARRRDQPPERAERAVDLGNREAARSQQRLLGRGGDHDPACARPSLHGGRPPVPGRGCEPERGVDGGAPRPDVRRAGLHGGRHALRGRSGAARGRELQHRPCLRLGVPARADRSRRDRRRIALGRPRERDVHLDRRVRPHSADADAPDHGALVGDAVHRLRHRDHRRNGRLGRSPCRRPRLGPDGLPRRLLERPTASRRTESYPPKERQ